MPVASSSFVVRSLGFAPVFWTPFFNAPLTRATTAEAVRRPTTTTTTQNDEDVEDRIFQHDDDDPRDLNAHRPQVKAKSSG